MRKPVNFNIRVAYAVSVTLHILFGAVFLFESHHLEDLSDETLALELSGMESDVQLEERIRKQDKAAPAPTQQAMSGAPAESASETGEKSEEEHKPSPHDSHPGQASGSTVEQKDGGAAEIAGGEQQQNAQTIQRRAVDQITIMRAYARLLSKTIQKKLVYPKDARQARLEGVTMVAVHILHDGGIQEDSLKVVSSSGQPVLDDSALQTIRVSAPFPRPPAEFTVRIPVSYFRKR